MDWAYGVTTVKKRLTDLLPRTLASLARAGFDRPQLFVDGARDTGVYKHFRLEITTHFPHIRAFGNWHLALWELYIRNPAADRYAIFQDDMVTYRNLRGYLEQSEYPEQGYCNLYTFPPTRHPPDQLPPPADGSVGWFLSNQLGKGAVALVFNWPAMRQLVGSQHLAEKPRYAAKQWKSVDGGVQTAMKNARWKEYVHNPSLVQHTGLLGTIPGKKKVHPLAESFRGEEFDAMELLP